MHMRVSQTNTTTPPARMQILQSTTKDTTQTNETDPPHLAYGDAHGKRTPGGNGVPGRNRYSDKDLFFFYFIPIAGKPMAYGIIKEIPATAQNKGKKRKYPPHGRVLTTYPLPLGLRKKGKN